MKNLAALVAILSLLLAPRVIVHAQGTIAFNNLDPSNGRVFIQHGLFNEWGTYPLNQDLNFALYAGPNAISMTLLHVWLLSDGSAEGINAGPGLFADPSHSLFPIAGVTAGGFAIINVVAWTGNYKTPMAAYAAGALYGSSEPFGVTTGSASAPPSGLLGMRPWYVRDNIPEPGTFGMLAVGIAALGLLVWTRRRAVGG